MSDDSQVDGTHTPPKASGKKKRRWIDLVLILVGLGCLAVFGLQTLRYRRAQPVTPSGEIMAGLVEVEQVPAKSGSARDYNVLLVTLDTTRADHVGCYGNQNVKTPNIDSLAREGVLFEKAITPAPSTLPGHGAILTGLYPHHHGARANGTYRLQPEQTTIAETLKEVGYATGAAISAYVLDSRFGLDQGFDDYDDDLTIGVQHAENTFRERPGEITSEAALKWLDENGSGKFFYWLHLFDPHAPYLPPEPFRTEYARNPYDGELAYADQVLGNVLEKLETLGVRDKTIVVIAGDHGESLGEHGEATHSLMIYDATMHTPLIISCSGLFSEGSIVHSQVANVDIVPTVLDLLGVESQADFDGVSLLSGRPARPEWIYGESISTLVLHGWAPLFFIRTDEYKYIHAPKPELYDLKDDPTELTNLFGESRYSEQVARLSKELDTQIGEDKFGSTALQQAVQMDAATAANMQALGYVGSTTSDRVDAEEAWQFDPKDMIGRWDQLQQAVNLKAGGKLDEAIEMLEALVEATPGDVYSKRVLSSAYVDARRFDEAREMLERAWEQEKHEPSIPGNLATIAIRSGEIGKAEGLLAEAMKIDPNYATTYVQLGDIASLRGDVASADKLYRKAIELDPGRIGASAYAQLGMMYLRLLRAEDARAAFEAALGFDSLHGGAHAGLGSILAEEGQFDEARESFMATLRFDPNQPAVLAALAGLYDKLGEFENGKQAAEKALELRPGLPMALNNLALIMKHTDNMSRAIELFEEALAIQPNDIAARLNLALCYHGMREDKRAAEEYEKVLQVHPRVPLALHNLGKYHESLGRLEEALDLYARAVEADPNYAFAHASLASMLLKQGKIREAQAHLKRAIELDAGIAGREQIESQIETLDELLKNAKPRNAPAGNTNSGTNGP